MPFSVSMDGETYSVEILARKPRLVLSVNGRKHVIGEEMNFDEFVHVVDIDGNRFPFAVATDGDDVWLHRRFKSSGHSHLSGIHRARVEDPIAAAQDSGAAADEIRAPMPGSVVEVRAAAGDAVKRGDVVLVIESMKLQTNLAAPRDGVIAELLVGPGDTFGKDAAVARLESEEE